MDITTLTPAVPSRADVLARIAGAADEMAKGPNVLNLPVVHRFTPGLYIRELRIPKGAHIITKVHKVEHPYVVAAGKLKVWVPGGQPEIVQAPHVGITAVGTVRLAVALEDSVWITFHPTDKTNVEEIEKDVVMTPREAAQAALAAEEENKRWLSSQLRRALP